ncbi:hypothetical protein Tco_1020724, partial [Tanacetum coccineum]
KVARIRCQIHSLQPVLNANLKWRDMPFVERHAYCEKLSKLQKMSFGVPRVANCCLFDGYGFEDTLREMIKLEYIYEGDGDVFVDYSHEHILTLLEFTFVLGLFTEEEVEHRLFEVYFGKLQVDDKQFDHKDYYTRVEIKKYSEPIDCDYCISKMLADELDMENTCLKKETEMPTQVEERRREPRQYHEGLNTSNQGGHYGLGGDDYFTSAMPDFRGSSSGNAVGGSSRGARFNDDDDDIDE